MSGPVWWRRVMTLEPAVVKAVVVAVVGVLALVGLDVADVGDRVVSAWSLIWAALPVVAGWWIRASVTPTGRDDTDGPPV